jgi:hypothetical protein
MVIVLTRQKKVLKIQFSTVASFEEEYIHTLRINDAWLDEPTITLGRLKNSQLIVLNKALQTLYWRILAQDSYGNEEIRKARSLVVSITK